MPIKQLQDYQPADNQNNIDKLKILDFIENDPDCFLRSNLKRHITVSAWLLSPDKKQVLLTHHKKLNSWIQLGGHADGDPDLLQVALKEAQEESGILEIIPLSTKVFDLHIHRIPKYKEVPEHDHYDVAFILQALNSRYTVSDESHDLAWINIKDLLEKHDQPYLKRMAHKTALFHQS